MQFSAYSCILIASEQLFCVLTILCERGHVTNESKRNIRQQVIKRAATSPEVSAFEQIKHEDENGEYWSARELAKLLGYTLWQNFERVIAEAKEVCALNGGDVERLFVASNKKSRGRDALDYRLTRHACYIIAESADGRKPQVAFAKIYFALTTERYELLAQTEEAGASVRALLVEKGIYPERLPTPSKSYQQLLREEEVRQRLLLEDQTGLWARLLAGQVDSLDEAFDRPDAPDEESAAD